MPQRLFRELQRLLLASLYFAFLMMFVRLGFVFLRNKFWVFSFSELGDIIYYGFLIDWRYLHIPIFTFFTFVTIPALFPRLPSWFIVRLGTTVMGFWTFFFILVGTIRSIYFGYFKSTFNHFIFQSQTEDPWLLLAAVNHDYPFWIIIPGVLIISFLFIWLWNFLDKRVFVYSDDALTDRNAKGILVFCFLLAIFLYGESVSTKESQKPTFTWEQIDILPVSPFAREAILNDFESFERAQELYKTYWRDGIEEVSLEELQSQLSLLHPNQNHEQEKYNNIELYLRREAKGALIKKPSHIFIIVSEAYSQWPLLDKYAAYHLSDGMKSILAEPDRAWIRPFIANSTYTSAALIPIVSGLTGVKTSPLHEPETYRTLYATSLAPQMTKLGYQSHFWYGGPGNWEEVRPYVIAQGFTDFHGVGDPGMPPAEKLSYWGAPDRDLFDSILATLPKDAPTVNVILTTSNHAPYNIDLKKEGFHYKEFIAALPPEWQKEDEIIHQLAHYWYADREMTRFIREMQEKYPDSLFIVTGDHVDRLTRKPIEGLFEWETVPLIIYGPGVSQDLFPENAAGGQINIIPTLIELIAPRGFTYYSLVPSLTQDSQEGFSSQFWITNSEIGSREKDHCEPLPFFSGYYKNERNPQWEEAALTYTWWRINRGQYIEKLKKE